jgi:GTPase involved in cell partitioning and DNA repair
MSTHSSDHGDRRRPDSIESIVAELAKQVSNTALATGNLVSVVEKMDTRVTAELKELKDDRLWNMEMEYGKLDQRVKGIESELTDVLDARDTERKERDEQRRQDQRDREAERMQDQKAHDAERRVQRNAMIALTVTMIMTLLGFIAMVVFQQ